MVSLDGYDRERAIADGLLMDVNEALGGDIELPCPVAVSAVLYRHPEIDGRREHIEFIVLSALGEGSWFSGVEVGEFSYSVCIDNVTHAAFVAVRVVVEPAEGGGVVATFLEASEEYDLRGPRAGSFYTT
jgi:hypothetical protein